MRVLHRKITVFTVVFVFCLLLSFNAYSVVPVVNNMGFTYLGADKIIRTEFDLEYSGAGAVNISLRGSNDGGKTFNLVPVSVTGDIGNILPGIGKRIDWKVLVDYPSVNPLTVKMRLIANDGDHNITYFTAGGTDMILVTSGNFPMGSATTPDGMPIFGDELPEHTIYLDNFYIDTREVTNYRYGIFLAATGRAKPMYWYDPKFNAPNQPVVGVTWEDAIAYCNWIGKRLPTEAEWEKAARGGTTGDFPWGATLDRRYANLISIDGSDVWYDTSPVASFLPNNFGLFDMIGNVYEWCSDYYEYYYYLSTPNANPTGPDTGVTKVLRGGSCYDGFFPSYLRSATRYSYSPATTNGIIGFRCVLSVPQ